MKSNKWYEERNRGSEKVCFSSFSEFCFLIFYLISGFSVVDVPHLLIYIWLPSILNTDFKWWKLNQNFRYTSYISKIGNIEQLKRRMSTTGKWYVIAAEVKNKRQQTLQHHQELKRSFATGLIIAYFE